MNATTKNAVRNYLNVLRHSQITPSTLDFRGFLQTITAGSQMKNVLQYNRHISLREADIVRPILNSEVFHLWHFILYKETVLKILSSNTKKQYDILSQYAKGVPCVLMLRNGKWLKNAGVTETQGELCQYDSVWYILYLFEESFSWGCTWANPQKVTAWAFSSHSLLQQLF